MLVNKERCTVRYTWKPQYILPYESNISIGTKFCILNGYNRWNSSLNKNQRDILFDHSTEYDSEKFGPIYFRHILDYRNIKYCSICIKNGYHSLFHQIQGIQKCFIHRTETLVENNQYQFSNRYDNLDDIFDYSAIPCKCIDNVGIRREILESIKEKEIEKEQLEYLWKMNFSRRKCEDSFCSLMNGINNKNVGTNIVPKSRCIAKFKKEELKELTDEKRKGYEILLTAINKDNFVCKHYPDQYFLLINAYRKCVLQMKKMNIQSFDEAIKEHKDSDAELKEFFVSFLSLYFICSRYILTSSPMPYYGDILNSVGNLSLFTIELRLQKNRKEYVIVECLFNDLLKILHREISEHLSLILAKLKSCTDSYYHTFYYEYDYPTYVVIGHKGNVYIYSCE